MSTLQLVGSGSSRGGLNSKEIKDKSAESGFLSKPINRFVSEQALFTASSLGVFDVLRRRPELEAAQVAQEINASVRGTERLLEACASLGLLKSKERRQFVCPSFTVAAGQSEVFIFAPFLFSLQPARRPFIRTLACPSASC